MAVEPTGILSEALDRMETMLEACATWADWTGGEQSVFPYVVTPEEVEDLDVFAIVDFDDGSGFKAVSGDVPFAYRASRVLVLRIEAVCPADYVDSTRDRAIWFANKIGALMSELMAIAGSGNYLPFSEIPDPDIFHVEPRHEGTEGNWIGAQFRLPWT